MKELNEEKIRWNPFLTATSKQIKEWGEYYDGRVFIRTSTKYDVGVVGRKGKGDVLDDTTFYPGCMARMIFTALGAYSVDGNQGINIRFY